jgi:hypothetical protein
MIDVHYRGSERRCFQDAAPKDRASDQPLKLITRLR